MFEIATTTTPELHPCTSHDWERLGKDSSSRSLHPHLFLLLNKQKALMMLLNCFPNMKSFNPHNNPMRWAHLLLHFADEETEAWRDEVPHSHTGGVRWSQDSSLVRPRLKATHLTAIQLCLLKAYHYHFGSAELFRLEGPSVNFNSVTIH